MAAGPHLVARRTVEIVASERNLAEALAARTSAAAGRLERAIESSLDAIDAPGLRLRLDRVELDLGACDPAHWEDALSDGIRQALGARIIAAAERDGAIPADPARTGDPAAAALELLGEFARTGRLPWWSPASATPAAAVSTLATHGCAAEAVRAVLAAPEAIARLVNQLAEPDLTILLRLAKPSLAADAAAIALALADAPDGAEAATLSGARPGRSAAWRAVLAVAAEAAAAPDGPGERISQPAGTGSGDPETARFHAAVALRLGLARPAASPDPQPPRRDESVDGARPDAGGAAPGEPEERARAAHPGPVLAARLEALARGNRPASALLAHLATLAPGLDARSTAAAHAALGLESARSGLLALIAVFAAAGSLTDAAATAWRETIAPAGSAAGEDPHDAIAVAAAGVVLVWPFLPAFFARLDWLDGDDFRDPGAQHRAVALLHYLATDEAEAPEQALPLAKLLAGLPLDAVHDPGEPLSEAETAGADALLEALLGHAPGLGRIGIAGLRGAFLTRPGLLATRDGHWLLRVERRTVDVLLDRLAWSVAWVRLPWMAAPVQVEW